MNTILIILMALVGLLVSLSRDKKKTVESIRQAQHMMGHMFSDMIGILLLIGLILTWIPTEQIENWIGGGSGLISVVISAIVGTVTLIPAFVAFPLIGSLRANGAGLMTLTAFLTTLTMVGFITMPLEIKSFGKKFALLRNVMSFLLAIGIAMIMGVIV